MIEKDFKSPLLSVIILAYNNQRYLPETIESVLAQDYPNMEVIISDDGSSDFDVSYWERYIHERYPNACGYTKIRKNAVNLGIVRHCNIVIRQASGKYIKMLPAGDLFINTVTASHLVAELENNNWQIATSFTAVYNEEMTELKGYAPTWKDLVTMSALTAGKQYLCLTDRCMVSAIGTIFTKKLYDELSGFDEAYRLLEDWPMWLRLTRCGIKIEYINYLSAKYRLGGVTSTRSPILHNDLILMLEQEILPYRELFTGRQWRAIQTKYKMELHRSEFTRGDVSNMQRIFFLVRHPRILLMRIRQRRLRKKRGY